MRFYMNWHMRSYVHADRRYVDVVLRHAQTRDTRALTVYTRGRVSPVHHLVQLGLSQTSILRTVREYAAVYVKARCAST